MTIRLNAELFNLAYVAVSTEQTRYYLNGVHVEPHPVKGALLVATDGHRMVCIHDADAECDEQAIIQLPKFARALCVAKKGKGLGVDRPVLSVDTKEQKATILLETVNSKDEVTRSAPVVTAHKVIIEGTFPDWRRVTPQGPFEPAGIGGFNSKLLSELGTFGAKVATSGMYFLRSQKGGEGSPVVVRWGGVDHLFAVLMPMRTQSEIALPSFLSEEPVAAVAA